MLAFRVRLNGKRVALAGVSGGHVLSAIMTSVVRDDEARRDWPRDREFKKKELKFSVGGMRSRRDGSREHVSWANLNLKVGDTVALTVVNAPRVDEPRYRSEDRGPSMRELELRELDRLTKKYPSRAKSAPSKRSPGRSS
jgi:hypothetical protein